jgi:hypothetical protein
MKKKMKPPAPSMYEKLKSKLDAVIRMDRHSPYFMVEASKLADKISWAYRWKKVSWEEGTELIDKMTKVFEGEI